MEELTLVHPDDKKNKVVLSNPIQVAAYKSMGYVEENELGSIAESATDSSTEVADLRAKLEKAKEALKNEKSARKDAESRADKAEKALAEANPVTDEEDNK